MASISNDPNGTRRILFTRPSDRKRVAVRLGHVSKREAERVCDKVEALVACAIAGTSMSAELAEWVSGLGDRLQASLAEHGLIAARRRVKLREFLEGYRAKRTDVSPETKLTYRSTIRRMLRYEPFERNPYLHEITSGDAADFMIFLRSEEYAEATIGKTIVQAKQFFDDACRQVLIAKNPFDATKAPPQDNPDRSFFVDRPTIQKVIDAAIDAEWRLIIALSRFGGLRCPSETLALTWQDINWETQRIRVKPGKTKQRYVPLFPELVPYLEDAFELAEAGAIHVITRYRSSKANLRTQLNRAIEKAGAEPWPRLFHNLRASRQTELEDEFPNHVVCAWIGNNSNTAKKHYLKVRDEHFEAATAQPNRARDCAQHGAESQGIPGNQNAANLGKHWKSLVSDESEISSAGTEPNSQTSNPDSPLRQPPTDGGAESCADSPCSETDAALLRLVLTSGEAIAAFMMEGVR